MAEETVINGEFSDNLTVDITGDDIDSGLTTKIAEIERENAELILENKTYKQQIGELKASIEELSSKIVDLKKREDEAESQNKALVAVAARAAELEADVSRLQQDLATAMSDLLELSDLKKDLEGFKERVKEKDVKLDAVGKERDLLLAKVEKLEGLEIMLRTESAGKENEIMGLKKSIQDLEVIVESGKNLENLKHELEEEIEKMKAEIITLRGNLKDKEDWISELEVKEVINGGLSDDLIEVKKKIINGGSKQTDWVMVGGSALVAVALTSVICYLHARKH